MSLLVVDASVALKWFLTETGSDEADALQGDYELLAPDLIIAELINCLWKAARRGLAPVDQIERAVELLADPFSEIVPTVELADRAWRMASELDHPAYDCFYLAAAELRRCGVVTADRRLLKAVAATPYAGLVRSL